MQSCTGLGCPRFSASLRSKSMYAPRTSLTARVTPSRPASSKSVRSWLSVLLNKHHHILEQRQHWHADIAGTTRRHRQLGPQTEKLPDNNHVEPCWARVSSPQDAATRLFHHFLRAEATLNTATTAVSGTPDLPGWYRPRTRDPATCFGSHRTACHRNAKAVLPQMQVARTLPSVRLLGAHRA